MRLTLRTLLAYMDDFLEQEDKEDIAEKLKNNEQATALLERIKEVMSRARLGAPQVIGSGMARDPNSVAEYLESTLAPEQVKLLETICLESDVHLGEVGAVHHIVTMILSEPAQVDPASRQRMYGLIDQPAPAKQPEPTAAAVAVAETVHAAEAVDGRAASAAASTPAAASEDDASLARRKPEVPEYLRSSSTPGWKAIALTMLGAALAMAIVLGVLYPDRVLGPLGYNRPPAPKPPAPATGEPATETPKVPGQVHVRTDEPKVVVAPPVAPPPVEPPPVAPPSEPKKEPVVEPVQEPEKQPGPPVVPPPPATQPVIQETGGPEKAPPKIVAIPVPVDPPVDPKLPGDETKPDPVAKVEPTDPRNEPPKADAPVAIGRNLTPDQIVLRGKSDGEIWERIGGSSPVFTGDRLLVLPAFRPLLSVGGVSLLMDGPTELVLGKPGADGVPELTIHYGHVVVRALSQPNVQVRINTGKANGVLTVLDAEATVGIDVRLAHPPGTDPEQVPPVRHADLYAARGKAQWSGGGEPIALTAPQRLILDDGAARPGPGAPPAWITASQITALDERAAKRIQEGMPADRSVKLSLTELLLQPRIEVRSLAARCCAYIDHFDPLIVGLSDEDQRASWATLVSELQAAVARDPKTAAAVRAALVQRRREKAPDLYRMLWGYTPLGLKNGDARRLVDTLDNEDLDFRVVAFMNLQDITGMGLYYRPEYNATKRKPSLIRWQKRLDDGNIKFANGAAAAAAP